MAYSQLCQVVQNSQTALLRAKTRTVLGLFILIFISSSGAAENDYSDVIVRLYSETMKNRSCGTACSKVFDIRISAASHRLDDVIIALDGAGKGLMSKPALWARPVKSYRPTQQRKTSDLQRLLARKHIWPGRLQI